MTEFPVPLDNLITYVKTLHPAGGPLENVTDAFTVSEQLGEQADALIGYFVDQARRSGASWSQIGAAMGVSKQAAQKRFVATEPSIKPDFSRFTVRARHVIGAARNLASGEGTAPVSAPHLAAGLLAEPEGLAAKVVAGAGITPEQFHRAIDTGPATQCREFPAAALMQVSFTDGARAALKESFKAALRLGHNYIGTEHILLGLLYAGGRVAEALGQLGLTAERSEQLVQDQIAEIQSGRKGE
jgi:hypothetical protein